MKTKMKLAGLLCLIGLFANIFASSATVGILVGDQYLYDMKVDLDAPGEDFTVTALLTVDVTDISEPVETLGITRVEITYDMEVSDIRESGDVPYGEDPIEAESVVGAVEYISSDAGETEAMIMVGEMFIDADYYDKTYTESESDSYMGMSVSASLEIKYDSNGVFEKMIIKASASYEGETAKSEISVIRQGLGSGIPGFPTVMVGIVSLLAIPLLIRKTRKL